MQSKWCPNRKRERHQECATQRASHEGHSKEPTSVSQEERSHQKLTMPAQYGYMHTYCTFSQHFEVSNFPK